MGSAEECLPSVLQFIAAVQADPDVLYLDACAPVREFIEGFGGTVPPRPSKPQASAGSAGEEAKKAAEEEEEEEEDPDRMQPETDAPPPTPAGSGEDYEKAAEHKQKAADAKGSGDYARAVEEYTAALQAQTSALTFANRGDCLLKLRRPVAAVADCNSALVINPDSAKALKIKGKALRYLGRWEEAHVALSKAMAIDFDPDMSVICKLVEAKAKAIAEKKTTQRRKAEEERAAATAKKLEERRKAMEEAKARAKAEAAQQPPQSSPFEGGMPGGMPGGFDFGDPEIAAGLKNPKVQAAFAEMMSGGMSSAPGKIMELMSDPEVGPVLQKLMSKMGGMGGMGGMSDMMSKLMSNPKAMAAFQKAQQNPRIMQVLQEVMANPSAMSKYQNDPELQAILRDLQDVL
uniref:STI1 domain-containing protein n=1 Tax=Rhizochromulina marina TaxID=1034831 RepID=A0A7S2RCL6_9STRA|mmetsp:Transcript_14216/g.41879  ORF Transcript_14216/g.41879 Transcript_14216/m.41879 type:complete len:404 (+) Transcript_14216:39-1250(+)